MTQFVWNTFMKDPAAQNGMNLAASNQNETLGALCTKQDLE